jgi:hypothetical protein
MANSNDRSKSIEPWIWDAACSIRGAKDAPKYRVTGRLGSSNRHPGRWHPAHPRHPHRVEGRGKLTRIDHPDLKKNDYNISPSPYIHTSDAETGHLFTRPSASTEAATTD